MGAGRIVHMDITRIDLMIQNGDSFRILCCSMPEACAHRRTPPASVRPALRRRCATRSRRISTNLLKMAKQNGRRPRFRARFMDGRDTLTYQRAGYLEQLQQKMREYNCGQIATVSGRYYAMDRDRRWERIAKAYNAMVFADAEGGKQADPVQA